MRSSIMPVNRKFNMAELLAACKRYITKTHRKVFFEHVLKGINEREKGAHTWPAAPATSISCVPIAICQNMGRDIAAACGRLRPDTQPKARLAVR